MSERYYLWHTRYQGWWTGSMWSSDFSKARALPEDMAIMQAKNFNGETLTVLPISRRIIEAVR